MMKSAADDGLAVATFAGGCFWCMEPPYDELPGVVSTTSGYTGGSKVNPTYEEVSSGATGHAEAVQVRYDPARIGYEKLLEVFWRNIDPLTADRQFCDRGRQYRSAIFYHDAEQRRLAPCATSSTAGTAAATRGSPSSGVARDGLRSMSERFLDPPTPVSTTNG